MHERSSTSKGKALLAATPLLIAGACFTFRSAPAAVPEPLAEPASEAPARRALVLQQRGVSSVAPAEPRKPVTAAPTIERVSIDQSVACRDEPLTVDVRARAADGDNAGLVTLVDGRTGNPGVISFPSSGDWSIPVQVYDRARSSTVSERELHVKIRDCDAREQRLELDVRQRPEDGAHVFVAKLPESTSADRDLRQALAGASLTWDFGDGATARAGVVTSHRYEDAASAMAMRTYVLRVEATVAGRRLRGKGTVTLHSEYLSNKHRGTVTPDVRVRDTGPSGDGYGAALDVTHFEAAPLQLDTVQVSFVACDPERAAATEPVEVPAQRYLSTTQLASGRSQATLHLPGAEIPAHTCLAQLTFSGQAQSGHAVSMTAHVRTTGSTTASEVGDREARRKTDPTQARALTRALALLGRELREGAVVTQEELALLKQRGELQDGVP